MISTSRVTVILLLGVLAMAAFRFLSQRQNPMVEETVDRRAEAIRQFWDRYQQASQKRAVGDLRGAASLYEEALALRSDHEDSLYYLGNCYFELGIYAQAIEAYQRLIAVNPQGSSRGYMQLGLVYACLEPGAPSDLDKAAHLFEQTLDVDPDSGALLGRGEVALLQKNWEKTREALEATNAGNPMSIAAPYLLGFLCYREGNREEAWRWFRLAVQRGEFKKPSSQWSEEGDLKADPELRWRALARQSVFGKYWTSVRKYLNDPDFSPATMEREYRRLSDDVTAITGQSKPS